MLSKTNIIEEVNNIEQLYVYKKLGKINNNILSVV